MPKKKGQFRDYSDEENYVKGQNTEKVAQTSSSNIEQPNKNDLKEESQIQQVEFEKKGRKKEKNTKSELFLCNICNSQFQTRNQLFKHIKNSNHALATKLQPSQLVQKE